MTDPHGHIWTQIEAHIRGARDTVYLVAPFIKIEVFRAVVAAVPSTVTEIVCVTRWSAVEVAAGVSDPEIIEVAEADQRIKIKLFHALHAKLFIADNLCLVGSANLTGKATGRVPAHNLEILVEVERVHAEVQRVLAELERAVTATPAMAVTVREQANMLAASESGFLVVGAETEVLASWYPTTRKPERMYGAYCGNADLPSGVREGVAYDLACLDLPQGLSEPEFKAAVRNRLRALPAVSPLLASGRLNSTDLESAISREANLPDGEARRATENIGIWLSYFDQVYRNYPAWELRSGREL